MATEKQKLALLDILKGGNPAERRTVVPASTVHLRSRNYPRDAEEGDTWTDPDGKEFVKTSYGWASTRRPAGAMPLFCPECEGVMNHRNHQKMYRLHGMCFDCVVEMEHRLRVSGEYELYEKERVLGNMRAWVRDNLAELKVFERSSVVSDVMEDGTVAEWTGGGSMRDIVAEYRDYLKSVSEQADDLEEEIARLREGSGD